MKLRIGIERRDRVVSTCDVRSSNLDHETTYSEVFRDISQPLQANSGILLKLGQNRFLPHPSNLLFINHLPFDTTNKQTYIIAHLLLVLY